MKKKEKEMREFLHNRIRARYLSLNPNGFKESIADQYSELVSLEVSGNCRELIAESCGCSVAEWVRILKLNYRTWEMIVNCNVHDFLAFQVFGLRAMNHGMKATVDSILQFYFKSVNDKPIDFLGDALLGFITDLEFFRPVICKSHSTKTNIDFNINFNQALQIGESSLESGTEGDGDDHYRYFFITNFNDFDNLMEGVKLFISDMTGVKSPNVIE